MENNSKLTSRGQYALCVKRWNVFITQGPNDTIQMEFVLFENLNDK